MRAWRAAKMATKWTHLDEMMTVSNGSRKQGRHQPLVTHCITTSSIR